MHILFLDESGKPDAKVFAVGGIAVRADRWRELRDRWDAALAEHGWPDDREIKWHGTQTGEVPPALADSIFEAIAGAPVSCYVSLPAPARRSARPTNSSSATRRRPTGPRSPSSPSASSGCWRARTHTG